MAIIVMDLDQMLIIPRCDANGQASLNVTGWQQIGHTGAGLSDQAIADYMSGHVAPAYKAYMSSAADYTSTSVQIVKPVLRPAAVSTIGAGSGTQGTENCPTQVSGLLQKKSDRAGRKYRGRIYAGFPSRDWLTTQAEMSNGGFVALGQIGVAIDVVHTITVGGNSATIIQQIWGPNYIVNAEVTFLNPSRSWATQRRRGDFGRLNP